MLKSCVIFASPKRLSMLSLNVDLDFEEVSTGSKVTTMSSLSGSNVLRVFKVKKILFQQF